MPDSHHALLTLARALSFGLIFIVLSRKLRMPTLVFLLGGGILCGPQFLGILDPDSLGDFLPVIVSLAVGVILFEGGLTLDIKGYFGGSRVIKRMLTFGVLITWLGSASAVKFFFGLDWGMALLSASLVIVTGPTVIAPLLKRIRIQPRLHHILQWEGVLIDVIGVFIALLCFEWVTAQSGAGGQAFLNFGMRAITGLITGVAGGWAIYLALKWRLVPDNLVNAFALAMAILLFGIAETLRSEAGLLTVTIAGLVVGWKRPVDLQRIREFKGEITELLIGMLFMLLSARLDLARFGAFGLAGVFALAVVLLIVRPLSIIVCTWGSSLNWRERVFLSWVAPRGIVAGSMASLFSLALARHAGATEGFDARFIETFAYSVIVSTVILQGFSAGWLAWALRLLQPAPTGWLVLGSHRFARALAGFVGRHTGTPAILLDRNQREAAQAARDGLSVLVGDALDPERLLAQHDLVHAGHLLALTDNSDLNELACHRWSEHIARDHLYRWSTDHASARERRAGQGDPIWTELPRPSLVSEELVSSESATEEITVETPAPLPLHSLPLLLARDGRVTPVTSAGYEPRKGDHVLVIRRTGSYLAAALSAGALIDVPGDTMQAPYTALLEALQKKHPALNIPDLQAELKARADSFPFDIGHGVCVPHAYAPQLTGRVCLLARDRETNSLTFLVLSPHSDADGHLATLGEIARACSQAERRHHLLLARNLAAVIAHASEYAHA
jgi:NhaP-type Na+/H+ or K+/H+ antiporter/mannitol/fructose-specific phosphotransferase system IIA component (Ntr-type)